MWIVKFGKEKKTEDLLEAYRFVTGEGAILVHKLFEISMENRIR